MSGLLQDVRFAWRMLVKNPGFTAVVVIAMGLGIGVNASIFTIVRGILMSGVPFPEPERIVMLQTVSPRRGSSEPFELSGPDFADFTARAKSFTSLSGVAGSMAYLTLGTEPERFRSAVISPSLLQTLGVKPLLGRGFLPEEGIDGKQYASVILSHRIWNERLGADPSTLGRTFRINGRLRTVVGVMPEGFRFPEIADFWFPLAFKAKEDTRDSHYLEVFGRLAPGVSVAQARAEAATIAAQLAKENPATNDGESAAVTVLHEAMVREVRPSMIMLMCAVSFVLLIACANVANLMLARASARQRELSLRMALGAGRGRIARQLLTESVLIALLGGVLGVFIAYWGNDFVLGSIPVELPYWMRIRLDGTVLGFTAAISIVSGLLFGIAPALHVSRRGLYETLKEGGLQGGSGRGHQRVRNGLVVAEVALAMVLLVGSGLMIRSFLRMQERGGNVDPEGVLTGTVTLPVAVYPEEEQRRRFFAELLPRLRELPGVMSASAGSTVPLTRSSWGTRVALEGHVADGPSQWPRVNFAIVTPGYFSVLRTPLRSGRDFTAADGPAAPRVAIVNQSAATLLWPGADPLGRRFKLGAADSVWTTVVGVTADVRQNVSQQLIAEVFVPHAQDPIQTLSLFVRTSGSPTVLTPAVRRLIQARDPDLPFYEAGSLPETMHQALWEQRIYAWLMGVYSFIALVIAAVGIYGVMAYRVSQRTQEIGIRMALGAPQGAVLRMVVGQGVKLTIAGLGVGLAAAFALTRLMASLLFGVDPNDPPTFVGVALILAASALMASWLPAWRASRVDPMTALRHE